jgi:hypothetical protein
MQHSPDEEIEHDITCWMIAAIFSRFTFSASSIGRGALIAGADLRL